MKSGFEFYRQTKIKALFDSAKIKNVNYLGLGIKINKFGKSYTFNWTARNKYNNTRYRLELNMK